jgi:hypothetical protein
VPSKSIKNHGDGDLCKCCRDFAESEKKAGGETKARADAFAHTQAQHKAQRDQNAEAIQTLAAGSPSATHCDEDDDSDEDCPITLLEQKRMNDEKKRKRQLLHQRIIEANTRPNSPAVAETTTPTRVHFSPSTAKASSDSSVGTAATVEMKTPDASTQSSATAAAAAATPAASGAGAPGRSTKKRNVAASGTAPAAAATLDASKKQKHHHQTTAFAAASSSSSSSSAAAAPAAVLQTPSPTTRRKARASSPKNKHN